MRAAGCRIVRSESVRVVHCRSFPPALIGWELKRRFGVEFIFDFRDFYADGGIVKARGLKKALSHGLKRVEGPLIRAAAKVVCLTEKAASVLAEWYLADDPKALGRFQVVPCCADFSLFDPSRVSEADLARARAIAGVSPDDFVLLYLGSLGPDYLLDRMMALFVQLMKERSTARFVFLRTTAKSLCSRPAPHMASHANGSPSFRSTGTKCLPFLLWRTRRSSSFAPTYPRPAARQPNSPNSSPVGSR